MEEAVSRGARGAGKLHALEMDRGKTNHACIALRTFQGMCLLDLRETERKLLDREAGGGARGGPRGSTARAIDGLLIN